MAAALLAVLAAGPVLGAVPGTALAQQRPPTPVEAAPVEVGRVTEEIAAVGTLVSNESVILRPEIAGRIAEIHFQEGRPVEEGALLFTLDDSIYRAELAEAAAALKLAERNYSRADELTQKGHGTARSRDEALATLETDRAAVELARARLDKTRLLAPFGGIVGLRRVSLGDYVQPGQDLVNLENIDPIKVDFRVPERALPALTQSQSLEVSVDAFPGEDFPGEVYALDPKIDAEGRSVAIRALVPNEGRKLRPGLFARVRLIVAAREQALQIPEQAVMPRGTQRFVFKVVDGKAVTAEVTLGQRRAGKVEVVSGLAEGDVVITAGQLKIRDGAAVEIVEPAGAGAGGGSGGAES